MQRDNTFVTYLLEDVFSAIPGITAKSMFGGFGLYQHGRIFAIISDDIIYMKVNETNRSQYERYGSKPFTYTAKGKIVSLSYWQLPDEILSDEILLSQWILQSASLSSQKKK